MAITTTFFVVELVGAYISNLWRSSPTRRTCSPTSPPSGWRSLPCGWPVARPSRADLRLSPRRDPGRARQCGQLDCPGHLHLLGGVAAAPGTSGGGERSLLVVAVAGMLANIASAWVLSRGGGHRDNLNTRGAFLHVLGDLLGSVATIAAALIITFTAGTPPIRSYRCSSAGSSSRSMDVARESVDVLLEAAPRGVVIAEVRRAMDAVPGVAASTISTSGR